MARTSEPEVKALLDLGPEPIMDPPISATPFIDAANALVDWIVENCEAASTLSDKQLRLIESWLAAHYFAIRDGQYTSRSQGGASGTFQGQTSFCFFLTFWGQQAVAMDTSGCLAQLQLQTETGKRVASMGWLGKPKSSQIPYRQRS